MKKIFDIILVFLIIVIIAGLFFYNRWKPLWTLEAPQKSYNITYLQDDTVRVIMIGDSWVGMRTDSINNLFQTKLSEKINRPVILKTNGKDGEKCHGIYHLMFQEDSCGTKPLFISGADYCVVFAGINDAASNLGVKQFVYYMRHIIDFLLINKIRPVLIEIPDINFWTIYDEKPLKDLVGDYVKSLMTNCGMYHFSEYREALHSMLKDNNMIDSVIMVPMRGWNGEGFDVNKHLFLEDQKHLNHHGYIKLDSCIVDVIQNDLNF